MTVVHRADKLSNGLDEEMPNDLAAAITNADNGFGGIASDETCPAEIRRLADLRNATILAHNYQLPAIHDIADHVRHSLTPTRLAPQAPDAQNVLFRYPFLPRA